MKIVKVKCIDMAYSTGSWELNHLSDFSLIQMDIVGYLVEDRTDCIILAKEYWDKDHSVRHLTAVPKVCILSQEELDATV